MFLEDLNINSSFDFLKFFSEADDNQTEEFQPEADTPANNDTNEADDNQTEEFQPDDTEDEETQEEENTEEVDNEAEADDNQTEEFQPDDAGDEMADDGTGEDDESVSKKYILLTQYRELHNSTNKLLTNVENFFTSVNIMNYDESMYIFNNLKDLKERIIFTMINKFNSLSYEKLLELFFYFQSSLKNLNELIEKLLADEEINKQI